MDKTALTRLVFGILAAALALFAASCADTQSEAAEEDGSLRRVLEKKELVLGLDAEFPPMGFIDETGEIVGFDIDVAQEVCSRLGVALVKRPISWEAKDDELNSGAIDCIWNGMSATPARAESMALSEPYMKNELIFVVTGSSTAKGLRDLKGGKVGVQSGSTAQEALENSDIFPDVTLVPLEDNLVLLRRLSSGSVDAALVDSVTAYYFLFSTEDRYFVLPDSLGEEEYVIGFRKNDIALRGEVQTVLGAMKADGTLGDISRKWFGSDITTIK
ncbi:MAG: amino acid ABC transporter substrate-binding protein [Oscillospiraceae bacterium]|nr:amino acid ABC transporter substrate-binding protein [Oscillospiraceae bacterium]